MRISLIVPTRRREQLFREFIHSVWEMTYHKKDIDLHIICDDDDTQSLDYVLATRKEYIKLDFHVHLVKRKNTIQEFNINEDYYNFAARIAQGDLIWILADDLEIVTPNWDVDLITEVNNFSVKYPDKIFTISILDNTKPPSHKLKKFGCFPCFTKEAKNALEKTNNGGILHRGIRTWGADFVNVCIFDKERETPMGFTVFGLDRILELHKKNYLNHKSWHTKQTGIDETHYWIGHVFNQMKLVGGRDGLPYTDTILRDEVPIIVGQLRKIIKEYDKKIG